MSGPADFFAVYLERGPGWIALMGRALGVTLEITALAFVLALAIGLIFAMGRLSRNQVLRTLAIG
jgi:ABC-type amino acid transport system permease subunit